MNNPDTSKISYFPKSQIIILLLTIVGFIIRFHNLAFQMTNQDEQFTMGFASPALSAVQVFWNSLTMDYTPPIYYLCAHFSMMVFGISEFAIRFPSVIFGTLLIPAMFLIGKEYQDDDLYGLFMAGFATIYYNGYFYSKLGRSYSAVLFFFSIAFYFFIRCLKGDKHSEIWFGIFAVMAMWSHLYSSIPIGIMTLYLVLVRGSFTELLPLSIGSIPLAYFYIPLVLDTRVAGTGQNVFGMSSAQILIMTPFELFGYSAIPIGLIIAAVLLRKKYDDLIFTILITVLFTWWSMIVLSFKTPIISHYLIVLAPMLILALIYPFWEQAKTGVWKMRYVLALVMIVVLECYQIVLLNVVQRIGTF